MRKSFAGFFTERLVTSQICPFLIFIMPGVLQKLSVREMTATTRFDGEYGDETRQTVQNKMNNFISERHNKRLSPLRFTDISVCGFSTKLADYLSVLNGGGSIAFSRGEELASIRLSKSLEGLFTAATPSVREGPPLAWATVILFVGPHFEGPSQIQIGESSVELSDHDLELLCSGRPWRFLCPWPDRDDCTKELRSSELVLQELIESRQAINEGEHTHELDSKVPWKAK